MELWLGAFFIVVIALLMDRFIGELPNSVHPLRWLGNILGWIDNHITDRGPKARKWGFLSFLFVFLLILVATMLILFFIRALVPCIVLVNAGGVILWLNELVWIVVSAAFLKVTFAVFSFRRHTEPIRKDLRDGRIEDAAAKVQMIVSRNTKGMDADHIASSCCESISENLVDSVISPTFYGGLLGVPGAIMFRCANLMDAMWGYLNDKYRYLGFFPAKFDDYLGYLTARISPYFVALASVLLGMKSPKTILEAAKREHAVTASPNSGYPMTSCAAALGVMFEKKDHHVMGTGPMPDEKDIKRCYRLVELTSVLFILLVMLPLYMIAGVHIQIFFENLFGMPLWGLL